jgi:hypothetical protein
MSQMIVQVLVISVDPLAHLHRCLGLRTDMLMKGSPLSLSQGRRAGYVLGNLTRL